MFQAINTKVKLNWKDLLAKIDPKTCALLLTDEKNFIFAWDTAEEIVMPDKVDWNVFSNFRSKHQDSYSFGFLGYDLKNSIEQVVSSNNKDFQKFPEVYFFIPQKLIQVREGDVVCLVGLDEESLIKLLDLDIPTPKTDTPIALSPSTTKDQYIKNVKAIQDHIQRGDIYEMNYCINFTAKAEDFSSIEKFKKLVNLTEAPFSSYLRTKWGDVLSASPERFIKKDGQKIISQPIKGTARRSQFAEEDEQLKKNLAKDQKEISENVMIVDLVRNDLSKIASKNSVKVEELFKVYTFKSVHQLISTVSCQLKNEVSDEDIIKALFPMGSMTGAPKISAMQIAEKFEDFKRGIYSGAIGCFKPGGDFDFNVVIRSIIYSKENDCISAPVGGAITIKSDPEKEYEECLIKLNALQKALC